MANVAMMLGSDWLHVEYEIKTALEIQHLTLMFLMPNGFDGLF